MNLPVRFEDESFEQWEERCWEKADHDMERDRDWEDEDRGRKKEEA